MGTKLQHIQLKMKVEFFINFWNKYYQGIAPIGHQLRDAFKDRWFRVHSLPNSKRYAENKEEYELILQRQNNLITNIIGENSEIIMLIVRHNSSIEFENYASIIELYSLKKVNSTTLFDNIFQVKNGAHSKDVFIQKTQWQSGKMNDILKRIADDEIRMLFVSISKNRIIAPYDGGVDVFLENSEIRDRFKITYSAWLSCQEDGL